MQAVEIRIEGSYWDSFLYDDRLYLFTRHGTIEQYGWDRLVSSIAVRDGDHRALRHLTGRGKSWYAPEVQDLLTNPELLGVMQDVATRLSSLPIRIPKKALNLSHLATVESPAYPHTDVEAFYDVMYIGSPSGVYATALSVLGEGFPRSFDAPILRLSASYGSVAMAAGSEGLFEQRAAMPRYWPDLYEPHQVSDRNCTACSWASFDVVASSVIDSAGFIAAYSKPERTDDRSLVTERQLVGIVDAEVLFDRSDGLMFGAADALVLISGPDLVLDRWSPYRRREKYGVDLDRSLTRSSQVRWRRRLNEAVLDGAATVYGILIELENSLVLLATDGTTQRFREPVSWRSFPRSERYLNQLHVVYEDHVRIYAFWHDYFVPTPNRGPAIRRPRRIPFG